MMNTGTDFQKLYTSLGYLFYSVAASDGKVRKEESARLKTLIREKWLPLENSRDEFGTDAAHYIGISFEFAIDQHMDPDAAFDRFKKEYEQDPAGFDPGLRRLTFETAAAIASAFAGNNKSELGRLARLGLMFKE